MAIRVVVVGAAGRMGQTAVKCLSADPRFELVGLVGRTATEGIEDNLEACLDRTRPDVLLELTTGRTSGAHALAAINRGIKVVVGSTGMPSTDVEAINASGGTCFIVPNFAIGAVLMMRFAELAAKWLPDAEIIELHHERKVDAPSGTAMRTAELIGAARIASPTALPAPLLKAEGARGAVVSEVPVHSVRLRGLLAHQEVLFGGQGEVLTIRHDSLDRSSFEAGILLACQSVQRLSGVVVGLENVLY